MKMNYQSGDKLKNRYLSNDAFTSLTNKLGGRSITSLGMRRKNSYKIANQGVSLFEYKSLIYKIFITILLIIICVYIIPQTRYLTHGYISQKINPEDAEYLKTNTFNIDEFYNVAPVFLKTDQLVSKQKDNTYIDNGIYVYDFITKNLIGITSENSPSAIKIKLFSDAGFKNNFLIEQLSENKITPASTSSDIVDDEIKDTVTYGNYQSYLFEGLGYGQIIAKIPPKTSVKQDGYVYVRTVDGLKPIAKIIKIDEDNKSTFTLVYAQLIVSPQNIYKVFFK